MIHHTETTAKSSLLDFVDTDKVHPDAVKTARKRINKEQKAINVRDRTYSVQLDSKSYQMLRDLKNKYDLYFYELIRDSLFLTDQCLRNNPRRHE